MGEVLRNSDIAILITAEALLKEVGIPAFVANRDIAVISGSISAFQPRVLVPDGREEEAREVLREAGMGDVVTP